MSSASIIAILVSAQVSAIPIVLAGVGGIFSERSGISNIGLEGTMLFAAFAAAVASYFFQNPWLGLFFGVLTGMAVSLLHAYLCVIIRINHTISGLAINILASNITVFLLSLLFGNKGFTPNVPKLPQISIPILSTIPVAGELFKHMSILIPVTVCIVFLCHHVLYKTAFGMHVIAAGENAHAAHVLGIRVTSVRIAAVLIGGFCCGLAGSFLSISYLGLFMKNMTSSRGFIAIATILFGRYKPVLVALAGLFFGLADGIQIALQGTVNIQNEIVQIIPYTLTILVVVISQINTQRRSEMIS